MADLLSDYDTPPVRNGLHNRIQDEHAPSLTELVSGIMTDTQTLFKQQVQMLRAEIREEVRYGTRAGLYFGVGTALSGWGFILLSFAVVYGISAAWPALPLWGSFLIVGALFMMGAAVACLIGRAAFKKFHTLPEKTLNAAQENLTWITNPRN